MRVYNFLCAPGLRVQRRGAPALAPPLRGRQVQSSCFGTRLPLRSEAKRRSQPHLVVGLAGVTCLPRCLESEHRIGAQLPAGAGAHCAVPGTVKGDEGNDTIEGGEGYDNLSGGDGDDYITGGARDDYIRGEKATTPSRAARAPTLPTAAALTVSCDLGSKVLRHTDRRFQSGTRATAGATSSKSCSAYVSELLNDLAVAFDGQYFAQVRRYYDERRDIERFCQDGQLDLFDYDDVEF